MKLKQSLMAALVGIAMMISMPYGRGCS